MKYSLYFYLPVAGFFGGILLRDNFIFDSYFLYSIIVTLMCVGVFSFVYSRKRDKNPHAILLSILFVLFILLGVLRAEHNEAMLNSKRIDTHLNKKVSLIGLAWDESMGEDKLSLHLTSEDLLVLGKVVKIPKQSFLVSSNVAKEIKYGDTLIGTGTLKKVENFDKESRFDYEKYLKKDDVQYKLDFATVDIVKRDEGNALFKILFSIKRYFVTNIYQNISAPYSALASGMTIAGKGGLPKSVEEDFIKAGLIHIVVLSGFNIAIVISAVMNLFGFLGRKWKTILAVLFVSLFVIMAGATAPVLRSAIMASIVIFGSLMYKNVIQNRALFLAAFVMVFIKPLTLLYDPSFALSFIATFAIINIAPILFGKFTFMTEKLGFRQTMSETLGVTMLVFPYILYMMQKVSIIAPISNIFVVPLTSIVMLLTFVVGILGFMPIIIMPISFMLWMLLWYIVGITHFFANLPFALFETSIFTLPVMIICYILLFVYFAKVKKRQEDEDFSHID